jgi:hypothetical protein
MQVSQASGDGVDVKPAARKALILGGVAIIVIAGLAAYARHLTRPREYELKSATITSLEFERQGERIVSARGVLEFVHPRSGQTMSVTGTIPADCPIFVDGAPAQLPDLRVGDQVAVRGTVFADRTITPQWVRVQRSSAARQDSASAPSTQNR